MLSARYTSTRRPLVWGRSVTSVLVIDRPDQWTGAPQILKDAVTGEVGHLIAGLQAIPHGPEVDVGIECGLLTSGRQDRLHARDALGHEVMATAAGGSTQPKRRAPMATAPAISSGAGMRRTRA